MILCIGFIRKELKGIPLVATLFWHFFTKSLKATEDSVRFCRKAALSSCLLQNVM